MHRVQRVPVTESQGRIHTSAAGVLVLPEAEDVDVADRPERPADRRVPLVRPGRPVGQHHRLRGADHPPADRHRGLLPEREEPAAEPGAGDADPAGPAAGRRPGAGRRGGLGRPPVAGAHGGPLGAHPHVQLPAEPDHRPPDRLHRVQPRPGRSAATWTACSTRSPRPTARPAWPARPSSPAGSRPGAPYTTWGAAVWTSAPTKSSFGLARAAAEELSPRERSERQYTARAGRRGRGRLARSIARSAVSNAASSASRRPGAGAGGHLGPADADPDRRARAPAPPSPRPAAAALIRRPISAASADAGAGQHHHELVAAVAGHEVAAAHHPVEHRRRPAAAPGRRRGGRARC